MKKKEPKEFVNENPEEVKIKQKLERERLAQQKARDQVQFDMYSKNKQF